MAGQAAMDGDDGARSSAGSGFCHVRGQQNAAQHDELIVRQFWRVGDILGVIFDAERADDPTSVSGGHDITSSLATKRSSTWTLRSAASVTSLGGGGCR